MLLVAPSCCIVDEITAPCCAHTMWKMNASLLLCQFVVIPFFFCCYSILRNKLMCKWLHQKFCIVTCIMSAVKTRKKFLSCFSAWCNHVREKTHNLFCLVLLYGGESNKKYPAAPSVSFGRRKRSWQRFRTFIWPFLLLFPSTAQLVVFTGKLLTETDPTHSSPQQKFV